MSQVIMTAAPGLCGWVAKAMHRGGGEQPEVHYRYFQVQHRGDRGRHPRGQEDERGETR